MAAASSRSSALANSAKKQLFAPAGRRLQHEQDLRDLAPQRGLVALQKLECAIAQPTDTKEAVRRP